MISLTRVFVETMVFVVASLTATYVVCEAKNIPEDVLSNVVIPTFSVLFVIVQEGPEEVLELGHDFVNLLMGRTRADVALPVGDAELPNEQALDVAAAGDADGDE
ncbi:unnamed protein product [Caenorhabditis sp. 36 PRJEB53466]|nr:unnamed protein product [Caenorhabditis sp. 36 PRJEB53466]